MSFLPSSSCYHFSPSGYQTAAGIAFVMNRPGKRKADDPASPVHGSSPASPASPVTNSLMPTASPFSFGNAANSFAAPAGGHPTSAAAHQPREFKRRAIRAQDPVVPFMPPQQVPPAPMDVCDDQGQDSLNAMAVEGADVDADGSVGGSGAGGASWVPGWSQYSSPSLELAQARVPAHQRLPSDSMDMS